MNKLHFLLVCENAFVSDGSKNLNLINIFDTVNTPGFPATHPRLSIVSGVEAKADGTHELKLVVKRGAIVVAEKTNQFTGQKHRWIYNHVGLTFPEPGAYDVELSLDGKPLGQTMLTLNQAK